MVEDLTPPRRRVQAATWIDAKRTAIRAVFVGIDGESIVPDDELNSDRQAIRRWQDLGNTIGDEPSE